MPYVLLVLSTSFCSAACKGPNISRDKLMKSNSSYQFPSENQTHEGTWLIWPHEHTYGNRYAKSIEPVWISMTEALSEGEHVHPIAYHEGHKQHIEKVLSTTAANMEDIDFLIAPSDDVWIRDTGPIFAYDQNENLTIVDFVFDGWGKKKQLTF